MRRLPAFVRRLWLITCVWGALACAPTVTSQPVSQPARADVYRVPPAPRALPATSNEPGVAVGVHGAVASAEPHATRVGLEVLKAGGNAIDAAVAVAFALAVTHPAAGNLGGGGFMVLRTAAGDSHAIDYRETAPGGATRDMFLDDRGALTKASIIGPLAAGIPGTVAGLDVARSRFGTKPWAELVAPAIALARDGHAIDTDHAQAMAEAVAEMRGAGFEASARMYLDSNAQPMAAGSVWKQPELAQTLQEIAADPRAFYTGALAQRIVRAQREAGGIWTAQDLAQYRPNLREPIRFSYREHEVITMPLPSAGGIVMRQVLFASELLDMRRYPYRSAEAFHLYVEAVRRAYADRNFWLGDADFVQVPVAGLLDPAYITERMRDIDPAHASRSAEVGHGTPRAESTQTTHFSIIDEAGNAVSNTYTLNTSFGAKLVLSGTGILLNDEMDDFAGNPGKPNTYGLVQGEQNRIQPGKRMLSSMTPTILVKDGRVRAVLGTPGGPTITTTVIQLVRALIDYGVTLDVAVRAPRVHHQWLPDHVTVERGIEPAIMQGLAALGHTVVQTSEAHPYLGHANCVEVDPATLGFRAVADVTRGGGGALAY